MGTTPQPEEPRVQVQVLHGNPKGAAVFIETRYPDGSGNSMLVMPSALNKLIADLVQCRKEITVESIALATPVAGPSDSELMAALEAEETITLSAPIYSGTISAAIAATGNFRHIWEVLDDADSPVWNQLSDDELRAIIKDYRHTHVLGDAPLFRDLVVDFLKSEELVKTAKLIFVGRAAMVMAASNPAPALEA